jgi:hypothetical protein
MFGAFLLQAGLGIAASVIQSNQQNAANKKADKLAEQKAQAEYKQQSARYEIESMQQTTQYLWDQARVAQLRSVEQQNALDQASYGQRLIQAAADNYRIQADGLYDQFVTQEALRGTQIGMDYSYTQNKLAAEALNQASDYLSQVNQLALQSDAALIERNKSSREILASIGTDHQRDMAEYQMMQLAAVAKGADTANAAVTRQGGGVTSQRLAGQALQALGQSYGRFLVQQQARDNQLTMLNGMNDEVANRLGSIALQMGEAARRSQYTLDRYGADSAMATDQLQQLQIPTFTLSSRQYGRELESLQIKTRSETDNALQPYRQQTFFDPLRPMPGLAPSYMAPTKTPMIGNGAIAGQAALSVGTGFLKNAFDKDGKWQLTDDKGNLRWA